MIYKYFHTIRYLKIKQIYNRILFNTITPKINNTSLLKLRLSKNNFCLPVQKKSSMLDNDTFNFLNQSESFSEIGWHNTGKKISKLWRYNQHYFNDLNSIDANKCKKFYEKLIENWIDENPLGIGVGWEPYPTSIRIVNWIKWQYSGNKLSDRCLRSLTLQSRWLSKRVEWHILGNHLFANAKALLFAGLFFLDKESENWLKTGLKIVNDELEEQILNDGGNFERSPMYHSIFLEDLLDIINISKVYSSNIKETDIDKWIKVAKNMLKWMETMLHPDGEISFFNDTTLNNSSNLDQLKRYSERLGIKYNYTKFKKIEHLNNSGYLRLSFNKAVLILDVAPIGPDYLPGHAHADTLSFELSVFGKRLMVNGGISEYEISKNRHSERSTKAHNTVEINGENSSEVWSAFRVARRAYPFDLKIEKSDKFLGVSCKHDGYKRLNGSPIHKREWKLFETSLIIKDSIKGTFKTAYAYFHLHPSINIFTESENFFYLQMPNGEKLVLQVDKGKPFIETSFHSTEFGKKIKSKCLKVLLIDEESCIKISW